MSSIQPLPQRIAYAIEANHVAWMKALLLESHHRLCEVERILLDVLAQNPDFQADGGLHARILSFLQQRAS